MAWDEGRLAGKVALVTGAARGIGAASALRLASEGAAVMCADIDGIGANDTAEAISNRGGRAASTELDVSNEHDVKEVLAVTTTMFNGLDRLDILFNNAGVGGGEDWERTIAVNLSGVHYGLFHGAPFLAERGGGSIVSTASVAGLVGLTGMTPLGNEPLPPGAGAYVAAKHGVAGLTRQYAITFGPRNVRVNAVAPGYIETAMTAPLREQEEGTRFLESLHPLGRLGQAEEVAAAVAFLASDDASFVHGVVLPVDGGYTAR